MIHRPFGAASRPSLSPPSAGTAPAPPTEVSGWWRRQVGGDVALAAGMVAVCFVLFYGGWPFWEDHGIYHYMAWGLGHDLKPYAATVNMNWPGIIAVHWLARALSGADPMGLRLLDSFAQLLLLASASALLVHAGVARHWRLLAFVAYLATYYATGHEQTAQRESFSLPLASWGLVACIVARGRPGLVPASRVLVCAGGFLTTLGLAVKPTVGLPLAVLILLGMQPAANRPMGRARFVGFFLLGCLLAGLPLVWFIGWCCDPAGFVEWGIRYSFGPYGRTQWALPHRLWLSIRMLGLYPIPAALFVAGAITCLVHHWRERAAGSGGSTRVVNTAAALMPWLGIAVLFYLSILAQGKTHCRYHFHPLQWSLAVGGVALLARYRPVERGHGRVPALLTTALIVAFVALTITVRPAWTPGTELARRLKFEIRPTEQVVVFGFCPTVLAGLEARTPFPYVDSWVIYSAAASTPEYRERIIASLHEAMAHPEVRYFVVEHRRPLPGLPGFEHAPQAIIARCVDAARLEALGYVRVAIAAELSDHFEVFEKRTLGLEGKERQR